MPKWLLPTLSEVVSLSDPTGMVGTAQPYTQPLYSAIPAATKPNGSGRRNAGQMALQQLRADREWAGAIAALNDILHQTIQDANLTQTAIANTSGLPFPPAPLGVVIAGPSPVLSHPDPAYHLSNWTLAATSIHSPNWMACRLLPAESASLPTDITPNSVLPILPGDPLATEQFCLVLTPWFSVVLVLGESLTGTPAFMFSFTPEVVQQAWEALRPRILLMSPNQVAELDGLIQQFSPVTPDYTTVMQFSRLLLAHLPDASDELKPKAEVDTVAAAAGRSPHPTAYPQNSDRAAQFAQTAHYHHDVSVAAHAVAQNAAPASPELESPALHSLDVELVKAIAHEVRTPLTTIRTLTRSLLRRKDLSADVLRRLGIIDRECSEQIDRFGLIFKAVELETSATHLETMSLTRTSLTDVLQQSIPRWQQQAQQRQMTLDVVLPQRMPTVVSDPTTLDQALTSLIERFTRNLPAGSHIQVEVTPAGNQLKLQLHSQPEANQANSPTEGGFASKFHFPSAKSLGHMLMFQPETGSLSLNLAVTKNLFQAIGGKLTVKQRPQQGEVMTVYLPLELGGSSPLDQSKIITV